MSGNRLVLVVEHNRRNMELLVEFLEKEGYRAKGVVDLDGVDEALREGVDLVLVDLAGFDRTVWEHCEKLRRCGIPFLIISPQQSSAVRQQSISRGASGVLVKPLIVKELAGLIRNLLEE